VLSVRAVIGLSGVISSLRGAPRVWNSGSVRVVLLGPLRLETDDGRDVAVGGARLRVLLARLALDPGRFVSVSALVDALWGDQPPADAGNALQSLVSRLRRVVPAGVVLSGPAGYQLAVAADDVDVTRFERLAAEGRAHLRVGQHERASAALAEAVRLWQGDALADVADAPFAGPVVARLTEARLAVAEDRAEVRIALGHPVDALTELDHLVAAHPLRERLVALRMRALSSVGRTADALADYQRTRKALADELGVDPSAELRTAHLDVLRGPAQPRPTPARGRADLPAPLTSFVGREAELADAAALLRDRRLVSLVGPGGAGKTRLAVELAAREATRSGGRVWFVELAPVREGAGLADVAPAVLSALDLRDVRILDSSAGPPRPPVERLVEQFGGGQALLVLDNCEHLLGGAAELADLLLRRCPHLSVLATTREPLAITGEASYRVGPLDLPVDRTSLAEACAAPAVRLFVDRASAARPGFTLDEGTLAPVTEICGRLDGMPLALELAAARLRSMTPHQVAELLDDRFRLLTVGNRTSLPRHRTLRGVVEWSWELLTEPERLLARRLATLAGGADEDAVVGVCAAADLPAADVPYLLASLVEKSLLTVVDGVAGRPRYRMLETVRAYGLAELASAGENDRIGTAFVRYFTEFTERVEPSLRSAEQLTALELLRAEHDNVVAAIGRACEAEDAYSACRLVSAMAWYWTLVGNGNEAFTWASTVAKVPVHGPDIPATVGVRLALLLNDRDMSVPTEEFDRYWADADRVGLVRRYPVMGMLEAMVRMRQGDVARATAAANRMCTSTESWARIAGRLVRCFIALHQAEVADAEVELQAALDGFRSLGERWGTTFTLGLLGQYRLMRGDKAGAVAAHEEAVRISGELGGNNLPPIQLMQLGAARGMSGDLDGAERDVRAAMAEIEGADGDLRLMGLCVLIHVALSRGDVTRARALADEADEEATRRPPDRGPNAGAALAVAKAAVALAAGEPDTAAGLLSGVFDVVVPMGDMSSVADAGERAAQLVHLRGDRSRAATLLGAAAGIRGVLNEGDPRIRELVVDLTDQLGEDGYRTAFDSGFRYDREKAVAELWNAVR
jgi:predicted ATPase/DNA-binding SARP family transcriptional activator